MSSREAGLPSVEPPVRVTCEGVEARGGGSPAPWKSGKLMTADTLTGGSTAAWSVCGPSLREEEGSERVGERERGGEGRGVYTLSSSCCSDKLLTAPATSTVATKDSWEGGRDRRVGLPYVSCLILQSDSRNKCQGSINVRDG